MSYKFIFIIHVDFNNPDFVIAPLFAAHPSLETIEITSKEFDDVEEAVESCRNTLETIYKDFSKYHDIECVEDICPDLMAEDDDTVPFTKEWEDNELFKLILIAKLKDEVLYDFCTGTILRVESFKEETIN